MGESGAIPFAGEGRLAVACAVAGALAEAGVLRLEVADPEACKGWVLQARQSNLPGELVSLRPGTTLSGDGVALLLEESKIQWVAEANLAGALRAVTIPAAAADPQR